MHKDKTMKHQQGNSRRSFLAAAVGVPALAAAATLTQRKPAIDSAPPAAPPDVSGSKGYHETEHIRKYYSTAAF